MPFQRSLLSVVACSVLFCSGFAGATTQIVVVESTRSFLRVENAEFNKIPPTFQTTLDPVAPDDWLRALAGSFVADVAPGSVTLISANIRILGAPLAGMQNRLDRRGNPRDTGEMTLSTLAFSVDPAGNVNFRTGSLDFDVSLGNEVISSPDPLSLAGVSSPTTNLGVGVVDEGRVRIPIALSFEDVQVFQNATVSFDVVGRFVPEPSNALTSMVALVVLAAIRRRRS